MRAIIIAMNKSLPLFSLNRKPTKCTSDHSAKRTLLYSTCERQKESPLEHWRRIYTKDPSGNESSRLISDLSALDIYRDTKTKVAISIDCFDGRGMKSSNVMALAGAAIDLDGRIQGST